MNTISIPMTVSTPSGFGMPICGHTSARTGFAGFAATGSVVRERKAATVIQGDMGLAATRPAYVKGTSAWSPPLS